MGSVEDAKTGALFDSFVGMLTGIRDELEQLRTAAPAPGPASSPSQDELVVAMAGSYQLPVVIVRAMVEHESVGV